MTDETRQSETVSHANVYRSEIIEQCAAAIEAEAEATMKRAASLPGNMRRALVETETYRRAAGIVRQLTASHRPGETMTDPTGNALLARIKALEAENAGLRAAVTSFFLAWDALPIGTHSVYITNQWLSGASMKAGIAGLLAVAPTSGEKGHPSVTRLTQNSEAK